MIDIMGDGNHEGKESWSKRWLGWVLVVLLLGFLFGFTLPAGHNMGAVRLLRAMHNAKEVYTGIQRAALDQSETGAGGFAYPADVGAKTNLEYVRYLVRSKVFKESDLKLLCKRERNVRSLAELKADDIAFSFANISEKDSTEAGSNRVLWIVRVSYEKAQTPIEDLWNCITTGKMQGKYQEGYVVMHIGGDCSFYTKMPPDLKTIGSLPPREPKFLDP